MTTDLAKPDSLSQVFDHDSQLSAIAVVRIIFKCAVIQESIDKGITA
jgi:hypothetical protein